MIPYSRPVLSALVLAAVLAVAPAAAAATAPPGYTDVRSSFPTNAGTYLTPGTVSCPAGTVVWGGGAGRIAVTGMSIAATAPFGNGGWIAQYNNTSTISSTFDVDTVCAARPKGMRS